MDGWVDGGICGWMDGWVDGRVQEALPIVFVTVEWLAAVQAGTAKRHGRSTAHVRNCCHPLAGTADLCQPPKAETTAGLPYPQVCVLSAVLHEFRSVCCV